MSVEVRPATLSDAQRMAEIHVAAWRTAYLEVMDQAFLAGLNVTDRREMWERALTSRGEGSYLAGQLDNVVRGFCVFGPARDTELAGVACNGQELGEGDTVGELVALNVEPAYWGRGVGYCLARNALAELAYANYSAVYLWVVESNVRAISLYERLGFLHSGVSKQDSSHSGHPITEIRFDVRLGCTE
jgi:ribosomal protein S18 acetylase RimI-like enzyme